MYQARSKKNKETNKFYWFTLIVVSILIIGVNVYLVLRRKPSIVTKAQPYLRSLPADVNLNILDEISTLQEAIPLKPSDFYGIVKKYSSKVNNISGIENNNNPRKQLDEDFQNYDTQSQNVQQTMQQ